MDVTVTLTETDQQRLTDIRRLRAADGKSWPSDKAMVESIVSRAILDELRDEQAYAEARENPMFMNERGDLGLIRPQAM